MTGGVRALVVGEGPATAALCDALAAAGWLVEVAADEHATMQAAIERKPAVVVLCPGPAVRATLLRLRSSAWTATLPVVAMADTDVSGLLGAAGAQQHVPTGAPAGVVADAARAAIASPPLPPTTAPAEVLADPGRIEALERSGLMDVDPVEGDPLLHRLTAIAAALLPAPISFVSLVAAHRQLFGGRSAAPGSRAAALTQSPIDESFCQWAVSAKEPLVVRDSREHPVLRSSAAVAAIDAVAYAGVPITIWGQPVGTVCAVDARPRDWSERDLTILGGLARVAMAEVRLRLADAQRPGVAGGRAVMVSDALAGLRDVFRAANVPASPAALGALAEVTEGFVQHLRTLGRDLSETLEPVTA